MRHTRFVIGITTFFLTTGTVVMATQARGAAPKPVGTTASKSLTGVKPGPAVQPKEIKPAATPAKTPPVKLATVEKTAPARPAKVETSKPATTVTPVALTPVQEQLRKNTNLSSMLASRLPGGTDLMTASAGFKTLSDFVAAVNVSNSLTMPFEPLKTKMVTDGKSLAQAIHLLKPASSATIEAQHAEYDARGLIAESAQQPQLTAASSTEPVHAPTKPKKTPQ